MSDLLRKYRASNPIDEDHILTLEIEHPAIGDPIRYAHGYIDISADTETETGVVFNKGFFGLKHPVVGVTGHQTMTLTVDNTSNYAWLSARKIINYNRSSRQLAIARVRLYLNSDLTTIQQSYEMECKEVNCDGGVLSVTAGYKELLNRSAFFRRYNTVDHPGLKYI